MYLASSLEKLNQTIMKNTFTLLFLFFSTISFSQYTVDMEVGAFNEIKVFDLIAVNMIQSDENRILIKGQNVDDIKWANKNGVLKLRMQLDKKFTGADTFIELYYTDVSIIDANEGAEITCNEMLSKNKIKLKAQEGGKIHVGMNIDYVEIRAVTGGVIEASGLAKNQSVVLNTGGVFEGRDLKTQSSEVRIAAGGEAAVYASEEIDVSIKAGGNATVYGNPKKVNKKTFVGGDIRIVE